VTILPDETNVKRIVFVADLVTTNSFRPIVPNLGYLDLSTAGTGEFAKFKDHFIDPELFGQGAHGQLAQRTLISKGAASRNTLEQAFTPNVPRGDITVAPPEADLAAACARTAPGPGHLCAGAHPRREAGAGPAGGRVCDGAGSANAHGIRLRGGRRPGRGSRGARGDPFRHRDWFAQ